MRPAQMVGNARPMDPAAFETKGKCSKEKGRSKNHTSDVAWCSCGGKEHMEKDLLEQASSERKTELGAGRALQVVVVQKRMSERIVTSAHCPP